MGTQGSRFTGGFHRFSRAVAARACQNGHLLSHRIEHGFDQGQLLIPAEGGGFTGGAADHQTIGAIGNQVLSQASRQGQIHRSIGCKRRHHRGDDPSKWG